MDTNTQQLIGYLPSDVDPPATLLTDRLIAELFEGSGPIRYEFSDGREEAAPPSELRESLGNEPYVYFPELGGERWTPVEGLALMVECPDASAFDDYLPLAYSSFAGVSPGVAVAFVRVLAEELPLEYVHVTHNGPYDPGEGGFPSRGDYHRKVMTDQSFINVLGPSVAAEFDRDRLLSAPAYSVEELADGSVLIRGFETFDDWTARDCLRIAEYVGSR